MFSRCEFINSNSFLFDINETLLDLEPLKKSIVEKLNNQEELGTLWFTTMLQYSLVVTTANQYFDFGKIGAATLQMIAENNQIDLSDAEAKAAIKPLLSLQPHPEVKEALQLLKENGYRLFTLTNSSNFGVSQQLIHADLTSYFEDSFSIEDYGKYKPATEVYHWAARKVKEENVCCQNK